MFSLSGESKGPYSVSVEVEGREGEDDRWSLFRLNKRRLSSEDSHLSRL